MRRAHAELGLPASMRPSLQGTAQAFPESVASEPMLILLALLAVYIVLGVLYESTVHPITILSILPSAGVGGAPRAAAPPIGQMEPRSSPSSRSCCSSAFFNKNGILMVDFALEAGRERGLSRATRSTKPASCACGPS